MQPNQKLYTVAFLLFSFLAAMGKNLHAQSAYTIEINLTSSNVEVEVRPPTLSGLMATFVLPFGNYGGYGSTQLRDWIEYCHPIDHRGKELPYTIEQNQLLIQYPQQLKMLRYKLRRQPQVDHVYAANAPIIHPDNKGYVLNPSGFFGYFEGYENVPVQVTVHKPEGFYGACPQPAYQLDTLQHKDYYQFANYRQLFASPMLYAPPDTISFSYRQTRFTIAVFSATEVVKAKQLYYHVVKAAQSAADLLGNLPIDNYLFAFYFDQKAEDDRPYRQHYGGVSNGASSFYALPEEADAHRLKKMIYRLVAHELLHLLTPYQLHDEQVADVLHPQPTNYLWLYEGVTEYFTLYALHRYGLYSEQDFWDEMGEKIARYELGQSLLNAKKLSKADATRLKHQLVYEQGALAALLWDIGIRKNSSSKGLATRLNEMAQQYGTNKAFTDTDFNAIVAQWSPQALPFVQMYLQSNAPLPYADYLAAIGMAYYETYISKQYDYGQFKLYPNFKENGALQVAKTKGNTLGLQSGDLVLRINGEEVRNSNLSHFEALLYEPTADATLSLEVLRNGQKIKLSGKPQERTTQIKYTIRPAKNASAATLARKQQLLEKE